MAFDEGLAERVHDLLDARGDVVTKKMFGGLAFMVRGHMAVGILKEDLVVRCAKSDDDALRARPHTRPMDFTGRPMKGWVYVAPEGTAEDAALETWVGLGVAHAESLPPK